FDEDDEGFQFKRVTSKKPRSSIEGPKLNPVTEDQKPQQSPKRGRPRKKRLDVGNDGAEDTNRTPDVAVKKSTRTTRNAAPAEVETQAGSTSRSTRKHDQAEAPPTRQHEHPEPAPAEKKRKKGRPAKQKPEERNGFVSPEPVQTSTATISLPMADTPVIQRNKEMRTKKSEKGNRRSSLGMRGRRASSLIDSGTSNALPHKEVDTAEFYKHIASDLPEPRRMRQLLIWCATRAMGDKPTGFHSKDQNARSEDQSARLAARVIQEEILKDFSMNSELSNWFEREDANPPAVVVKKPNPKNVQNLDKIGELEEQIQ
ncbi:Kinetochore protein mis13, partial [Aspergillus sclerotialis]